jgi:hypothetical protein
VCGLLVTLRPPGRIADLHTHSLYSCGFRHTNSTVRKWAEQEMHGS